ncbi:MAG: N-acetylmuramoyl-L-alanine amidase [Candidatus Binatia bacterium]
MVIKLGSQVSIGLVGLAVVWLCSESKLSAQVRGAPAPRQSLSTDAQSGSPKRAENQPLPPLRAVEKDKKPMAVAAASGTVSTAAADKVQVTGLRLLSWKNFTRVMLELSHDAQYEVRRLKDDPAKGIPPRMYVDIRGARLALNSKEPVPVPVDDRLLRQVRVSQYSAEVVRVVLDLTSLRDHNAFMLPDPHRLVIDLHGQQTPERAAVKEEAAMLEKTSRLSAPRSDQKTALPMGNATGIRKIVIDPGHGGKDPGAIGVGGIMEKDLVLSIAKKLAHKLKNEMGVEVVLTRDDDRFVALEDRTHRANAEYADLFISLHTNASANGEARGVETYYLNNNSDEAALRLAARENGGARKPVSDLQFILSDMTQNMKLEDSITLAHRLQQSMVGGTTKAVGEVRDLGVKTALFYVLVGARMPSVLVEMFFVTHRVEGPAMSREDSQDAMANSLFEGIQKYGQSIAIAKPL